MAARPQTKRIVVVSDVHAGSTMGLCTETARLQDGGLYQINKYQRFLLECWQAFTDELRHLGRPILVLNGDLIQGTNPRDGQIVGTTLSAQVDIATELLDPVVRLCSVVYCMQGTEWHEGKASEHVEALARNIGARQKAGTGQYTRPELYLGLGGQVIHFAHHIGTSSVPHYESTVPAREALIQTAELVRFFGHDAPNLRMVVRSHRHRSAVVWLPPDLWSVVTPAWQLKTGFSFKVAPAMLPEIGWTLIDLANGKLRPTVRLYPILPPHVEEV